MGKLFKLNQVAIFLFLVGFWNCAFSSVSRIFVRVGKKIPVVQQLEKSLSVLTKKSLENNPKKPGNGVVNWESKAADLLAQIIRNHWCIYINFATSCILKKVFKKELEDPTRSHPDLMYAFGQSLFSSGLHNRQFELEGLSYMEKSGKLNIEFAKDQEDLDDFYSRLVSHVNVSNRERYYDRYGMRFIGNHKILAPSEEHWENFKKEKLNTAKVTSSEIFDLYEKHDLKEVNYLSRKYGFVFESYGFICDNGIGHEYLDIFTEDKGQFGIIEVDSKLGKMKTIRTRVFPGTPEELRPVFEFAADAMERCGNASSVKSMFENLEYYIELEKNQV